MTGTSSTKPRVPQPGVWAPAVTFFDPATDELDLASQAKYYQYLSHHLTGLVILGTNAETFLLTREERATLVKTARDAVGPNYPLMAGVGGHSTKQVLEYIADAAQAQADYVLVLPCAYFGKATSAQVVRNFYDEVAAKSPLPIVLYNFPGVCNGVDLDSETIAALAQKHQNIVGVKLTCASVAKITRLSATLPAETFSVFGGQSDFLLGGLASGSAGCIAAFGNVFPKTIRHIYELYVSGNHAEALKLHRSAALVEGVTSKGAIAFTKFATSITSAKSAGVEGAEEKLRPRRPYEPPSEADKGAIRQKMQELIKTPTPQSDLQAAGKDSLEDNCRFVQDCGECLTFWPKDWLFSYFKSQPSSFNLGLLLYRRLTMAEKTSSEQIESTAAAELDNEFKQEIQETPPLHIHLTWKTWMVVFISCFAIMAQVYVVTAAGSVIAFIERDLGDGGIAGWIIQGPLLMQSVLSPFVGRLSDVLDRKYLASIPPLIAFIGAVVSAQAETMATLIGGGVLIGVTLATIAIVQAIPAEVLPLKYRALANGLAFIGGAVGGLLGGLSAGGLTNRNADGWRGIFWMQAAFHLATSLGLLAFYWPKRHPDYPRLALKDLFWAIDPIGSFLFVTAATLMLLALDWGGGAYPWSDAHVAAPLGIGLGMLLLFSLYEWKGRTDGIVAHVFFQGSPNFALACFAFAVEGWIFYSAVNSVTPQIALHLGFESSSWVISLRQLAYSITTLVASVPIALYATKYKDLKWPLVVTFAIFLVVTVLYGCIRPSWNHAQIGFNVIAGVGQAGPLTLLVAAVQFSAPHSHLSTATGLAFSARAIGGAFGSAVLDAIINGKIAKTWSSKVGNAALNAGLPDDSVPALLGSISSGQGIDEVPGVTTAIAEAALDASHWAYARAYRLAWWSIFPFVALALIAVLCLKDVKDQMTEHVEATVEKVDKA
ncbi:aldolase [Hortaea werneckii]|nr:aldolase [Hortaea werneckii]